MTDRSDFDSRCVERYAEYYRRMKYPCQMVDGALWAETNRMISPVGPACDSTVASAAAARRMLADFPNAILLRCTDGFDFARTEGPWYSVIGRKFTELSECNSKNRSQIKKGLDRCVVEKVDAEYIAQYAGEVQIAAQARYVKASNRPAKSVDRFRAGVMIAKDFPDLVDYWAVRHEGILVAYAKVDLYGTVEANYASVAYHPEYLAKCFASHALIHTMNEHYLRQRSFDYVNDGFRNILHPTGVQKFLVEHFACEHAYTNLFLHYRPWVAAVMSLPGPLKRVAGRYNAKFAALCAMDAARTRGEPVGNRAT